jgi:glycosyltransferase involved in cell wall biosynthesis
VDGTSAYLDELASLHPSQISIYRPPADHLWDGKIQMVSEPIKHIFEDCVLWQIDADELWTVEQLEEGRKMFLEHPEKSAAMFWCENFTGESLVVSTRYCHSQNPEHEWLRAWSFQPGMKWEKHEPPVLCRRRMDGAWTDVAGGEIFSHAETESRGLVFQHFAYVTEAQLAFKEHYYGYAGALAGWRRLQEEHQFPTLLRDFFPWVKDHTQVDTVANRNLVPLAQRNALGEWVFTQHSTSRQSIAKVSPAVVVDGIFFQLNNTGIARLWLELLKQWVLSGMSQHVWLLDRDGTTPDVPGIRRHRMGRFDLEDPGADSFLLQEACNALGADVFISTYYSSPISTPCVAMIYDMIPERLNLPAGDWQWEQKKHHLLHSSHFVCISQSTAHDLQSMHPEISPLEVTVAYPAAPPEYRPAPAQEITALRRRLGLSKDYIILSGERIGIHVGTQGYKNAALAFRAWSLLPQEAREGLAILCTGGKAALEESLRLLAPEAEVHVVRLSEEDLAVAYSGAVALIYPSLYEGFGLPVIEAMACGCPVITCRRASLVEVAGDAALFVDPWDPFETASAITALRTESALRSRLAAAGFEQAARFDFAQTASSVASVLLEIASRPAHPDGGRLSKVWAALREMQSEQQQALRAQLAEQHREAAATHQHMVTIGRTVSGLQNALAEKKKSLQESRKALKAAQKALKETQKAKSKSDQKLKEMLETWRSPLKRLWHSFRSRDRS